MVGKEARPGSVRPLRVLHLSTYDALGGAARSARRVHQGLCDLGLDSRMLVWHKSSQDERVRQFEPTRNLVVRLWQRLRREVRTRQHRRYTRGRRDPFQPFSDHRADGLVDVGAQAPRPDVVNLFWIGNFVDYGFFFRRLPATVPLVWRLSDMNAFTGGCHYAGDCERWTGRCGACPELGSSEERDLSRTIWQGKRQAYRRHTIHVVAPSRWLAGEAARSALLRDQPVTVIPNGLDTSVFRPLDAAQARDLLGLPQEGQIILAAADHLHDRRKGLRYLLEALQSLREEGNALLVTVGTGEIDGFGDLPLPAQHLGRLEKDGRLAAAYSAADLFVVPSMYENLPNTALEAMACGTPVVGFATGGIPDIVHEGQTGLLAQRGDAASLASQIEWLLTHPDERKGMGAAARRKVVQDHTLEVQARRFAELYQGAIAGAKGQDIFGRQLGE